MDGKKYLQDVCAKYNLDFNALFHFGTGVKALTEYNSEHGYKKSTITQPTSDDAGGCRKYVVKFMKVDQIYIAWRWKGRMTYSIFVKDVQACEEEINKVPHYEAIIGGKQDNILLFKPNLVEQFIGHYIIGDM